MEDVKLIYLGKKRIHFKNDIVGADIDLVPGQSFWSCTRIADFLLKFNYNDFKELERKGDDPEEPVEDAAAIIEKASEPELEEPEEPEEPVDENLPLVCPKCGKEYSRQGNLDRHLERCGK